MNGYLVGLTGHAGSGKDEIARIIADLRPDWVVRRDALADLLKISAASALGLRCSNEKKIRAMDSLRLDGEIVMRRAEDHSRPQVRITGRGFLQNYGTEAHRDLFGKDFWIDRMLPDPSLAFFGREDIFDLLVVTDVRFSNEVERVRACGGLVWLVDRPSVAPKDGDPRHRSTIIPDYDLVVDNSGDLDHLRDEVRIALAAGFR